MATKIYEGGLPNFTEPLHPAASMEGESSETFGGEGTVKPVQSGPSENDGFKTRDFLDDASYETGDMDVRTKIEMTGKTVNPDDLSTAPTSNDYSMKHKGMGY